MKMSNKSINVTITFGVTHNVDIPIEHLTESELKLIKSRNSMSWDAHPDLSKKLFKVCNSSTVFDIADQVIIGSVREKNSVSSDK